MTVGNSLPGRESHPSPDEMSGRRCPRSVLILVCVVATIINALSFGASQLWVSPDASYYVELAGGIADRSDFASELFLIRPPGYPLMLAAIFRVFGGHSPEAIMVVQHAMVVATTVLIAFIAWRLTANRLVASLAGVMAACSLQLLAYSNLIMTEVPYTLALAGSVCFLVCFHQSGRWRSLVLASLLGGVGYLFRPIGLSVVAVCVVAGLHHVWRSHGVSLHRQTTGALGNTDTPIAPLGSFVCQPLRAVWRRALTACVLAIGPAWLVTLPSSVHNKLLHGGDLSSRCANLALYFRILYMDKLDSPHSEALADIRTVVDEAIARGALSPDADYRLWGDVWKAYHAVRGVGLSKAAEVMGDAARDLIREHPYATIDKTMRYSLWMVLVPDGFYRFHPGGAPGMRSPKGECVRDTKADILAADTYEPMLRHWIDPYHHYLPLRSDATALTPIWRGLARSFYHRIEKGSSVLGIGDSPYEAFGWFCFLGMGASLLAQNRSTWLLIAGVIALQVVVSAFLAGPTPRYAVPVRPLLLLYPSIVVWAPLHIVRRISASRIVQRRRAEELSGTGGAVPSTA